MSDTLHTFLPIVTVTPNPDGTYGVEFDWSEAYTGGLDPATDHEHDPRHPDADAVCAAVDAWRHTGRPSTATIAAGPHTDAYIAACTAATTDQGLDPIITALADAGILYSVEQTGGMCMVVTVETPIGTTCITATEAPAAAWNDPGNLWLACFYPGDMWENGMENGAIPDEATFTTATLIAVLTAERKG